MSDAADGPTPAPTDPAEQAGFRDVITLDEGKVRGHLDRVVRDTVEQTLIRLVVSDKCLVVVEAAAAVYPDIRWQRCVVHFERNVLSAVPREKAGEVGGMLRAIDASEDRTAAEAKTDQVAAKLEGMCMPVGTTHRARHQRYGLPQEKGKHV